MEVALEKEPSFSAVLYSSTNVFLKTTESILVAGTITFVNVTAIL